MPPEEQAHLISISRLRQVEQTEVSLLKLRGAVRGATYEEFDLRLNASGDRARYLVVDLSELDYITATGLGRLIDQAVFQARRNGWLRVVAPSRAVTMILDLSGTTDRLPTFETEEAALRDLLSAAA